MEKTLAIKEKKQIYEKMTLVELVEQIVCYGDPRALNELHENRPLFQYKDKRNLLLVDFLARLKERSLTRQWCGYNLMAMDRAFDLTLLKFLNIPEKLKKDRASSETAGPDCRYYYDAYLQHVMFKIKDSLDVIEAELMAASLLETFLTWQLYRSCLECRRREQKTTRRIRWRPNGHSLTLWMPVELTSKQCHSWLQDNIVDIDPSCDWERDRIQDIIDRRLTHRKFLSLSSLPPNEKIVPESDMVSAIIRKEMSVNGFAKTLANEKADQIELQRPTIRMLGRSKLKALIHRTFDNLFSRGKDYQSILSEFDLTKATYNRFAGSQWHKREGMDLVQVPDLWKNAAHLLVRHPDFVEAAKQAGVWKKVSQVLEN